MTNRPLLAGLAGVLSALSMAAAAQPFERHEGAEEAAFPTPGLAVISNYTRVAPYVALAGRPGEDGIDAAAEAGFQTVIDLRQPDEAGVEESRKAAERNGLERLAMPMPSEPVEVEAFMDRLAPVLDDAGNYPVLLHCGSANRASAAWALYRARSGTEAMTALEEARAAGLTGREPLVREMLDLPPAENGDRTQ